MTVEDKLGSLGLKLPDPGVPVGSYVPMVQVGPLLFTSGAAPSQEGKLKCKGKLGKDLTVQEGYQAAKATALTLLSLIKRQTGTLESIERIVKVLGFVNSTPDFIEQHKVINGASDLFVEIFGEKGLHARSAVGMASLPLNFSVEIEMVVKLKD